MNYQRILSYLYDYDRGVKRRNIGFVKLEARGDQCRVNIHMKLQDVLPPEMLHAYFFFRRNDELLGIPFAELRSVGNECGVRMILPASFFAECGFGPEDFAGVYICQESQRDLVFVSAWDDVPVYVETFRKLKPAEKTKETEEQTPGGEEKELAEEERLAEDGEPAEEERLEEKEEIREWMTKQEEEEPGKKKKPTEEEKPTEKTEPAEKEYAGKKFRKESLMERISDKSEAEVPEERMSETIEATELADPENSAETGERIEKNPLRSPWEELAKNFTKFRIIDGDSTVECLKIRPHHLALLPRKYWNDASGSFLLHGYYTYKHIILARREPEEACFLGIPGKNRDRDRVMAAYYGYTQYLPVEGKSYGYWCRNISL